MSGRPLDCTESGCALVGRAVCCEVGTTCHARSVLWAAPVELGEMPSSGIVGVMRLRGGWSAWAAITAFRLRRGLARGQGRCSRVGPGLRSRQQWSDGMLGVSANLWTISAVMERPSTAPSFPIVYLYFHLYGRAVGGLVGAGDGTFRNPSNAVVDLETLCWYRPRYVLRLAVFGDQTRSHVCRIVYGDCLHRYLRSKRLTRLLLSAGVGRPCGTAA
jgi:hypothetical protein